jgi:hypothetical protein
VEKLKTASQNVLEYFFNEHIEKIKHIIIPQNLNDNILQNKLTISYGD